jgi:adenosylmethionine-8-amino-7-oxononanoate aminotransferase
MRCSGQASIACFTKTSSGQLQRKGKERKGKERKGKERKERHVENFDGCCETGEAETVARVLVETLSAYSGGSDTVPPPAKL